MIIAVLGYGLIGKERVKALCELHTQGFPITRILVVDPEVFNSKNSQLPAIAVALDNLQSALAYEPSLIIVCTPHDTAVDLVRAILPSAARVLIEKPLGRSLNEAKTIMQDLRSPDQLLAGFNYRFFPGVRQAINDALEGKFGTLISVSMILGHGGSPGMETGWKFDPVRAGGGCLIDPGIHLFDLCNLLSPDTFQLLSGTAWSGFWNTGIEEEVHLLLSSRQITFSLQVSVVRWRSTFRMEIHGVEGYGVVTGRGRSYGQQIYKRGKRWGWKNAASQADSEEVVIDSDANDSFKDELAAILGASSPGPPPCSASSALQAMELYDRCRSIPNIAVGRIMD